MPWRTIPSPPPSPRSSSAATGGGCVAALTETARLRALLPGGPIQAHGRDDVAARFHGWFADFDTVQLVESAGEAVGDRLLIHYRLHVTRGRGPPGVHPDRGLHARRRAAAGHRPAVFRLTRGV